MARVSVANFNAHWCLDAHGTTFDLSSVVASLDADVVVIEEVWRRSDGSALHETAAAELGYRLHELMLPRRHNRTAPPLARKVDGNKSRWGLAVLTKLPVLSMHTHPLPRVPLDPARRFALSFVLDAGGPELTVVATHLTHRPWGSAWHLRSLARVLPDPGTPAVALGDLNMWGPVVTAVLRDYRRAVVGRTWPSHRPHSQLDHILVNAAVTVVDSEVLGRTDSDHLPVRATLQIS